MHRAIHEHSFHPDPDRNSASTTPPYRSAAASDKQEMELTLCSAACLTSAAFLGAMYRLPFFGAAAAFWAWRAPVFLAFARPFVWPCTMASSGERESVSDDEAVWREGEGGRAAARCWSQRKTVDRDGRGPRLTLTRECCALCSGSTVPRIQIFAPTTSSTVVNGFVRYESASWFYASSPVIVDERQKEHVCHGTVETIVRRSVHLTSRMMLSHAAGRARQLKHTQWLYRSDI